MTGTAAGAATVSPMLVRLAAERATGALLRDHGTLYLDEGQVVHAESPAAPGIDVLLTSAGRLPAEDWQEAVDRAGTRGRVGRFLVDSGRLAGGELELCHLSALFDAAFFVLAPGSGPTRFRYGAAHWLGRIRPVSAAAVERESRGVDSCWTGSGRTRTPTPPPSYAAADRRGGRSPAGSAPSSTWWTVNAPRGTSPGPWAGRLSTRMIDGTQARGGGDGGHAPRHPGAPASRARPGRAGPAGHRRPGHRPVAPAPRRPGGTAVIPRTVGAAPASAS